MAGTSVTVSSDHHAPSRTVICQARVRTRMPVVLQLSTQVGSVPEGMTSPPPTKSRCVGSRGTSA